ncbi:hypothetical protein OV450_2528 [Actinobacteria bacterium OV450]|nr:hypothetical protein OV450_2528 [Actinobacteria bacterium OV450]
MGGYSFADTGIRIGGQFRGRIDVSYGDGAGLRIGQENGYQVGRWYIRRSGSAANVRIGIRQQSPAYRLRGIPPVLDDRGAHARIRIFGQHGE